MMCGPEYLLLWPGLGLGGAADHLEKSKEAEQPHCFPVATALKPEV